MVILFVSPWHGVIGPNVGMGQLARHALRAGYTVHIVASRADEFSAALHQAGCEMHYWPELELTQRCVNPVRLAFHVVRAWKVSKRLARLALQVGATIMCVNGENMFLAPRGGWSVAVPVVVIIRGVRFLQLGILGTIYFQIQASWVNEYIAVSQTTGAALVEAGVSPCKVRIICNGVDIDKYDSGPPDLALAHTLGIPLGSRIIGTVGHTEPVKGLHHLIEAFALVARTMPDAFCLLVGGTEDPPALDYVKALQTRVQALGISDRVVFTGYRQDVPRLLRLMDLVVHPSESESFGRSIAEAMASRRAVIGFKVGAVPELIVHGETGLVVEPFDIPALADSIRTLLHDSTLRSRMGEAARLRAVQLYDQDRNIAATLTELKNLESA